MFDWSLNLKHLICYAVDNIQFVNSIKQKLYLIFVTPALAWVT